MIQTDYEKIPFECVQFDWNPIGNSLQFDLDFAKYTKSVDVLLVHVEHSAE